MAARRVSLIVTTCFVAVGYAVPHAKHGSAGRNVAPTAPAQNRSVSGEHRKVDHALVRREKNEHRPKSDAASLMQEPKTVMLKVSGGLYDGKKAGGSSSVDFSEPQECGGAEFVYSMTKAYAETDDCDARDRCLLQISKDCAIKVKMDERCKSRKAEFTWSKWQKKKAESEKNYCVVEVVTPVVAKAAGAGAGAGGQEGITKDTPNIEGGARSKFNVGVLALWVASSGLLRII